MYRQTTYNINIELIIVNHNYYLVIVEGEIIYLILIQF